MMTSGKHSGSYHDLGRPSTSGWSSLRLQQLLSAAVLLFLIPTILFAFINFNSSNASIALRSHSHAAAPTLATNMPQLIPTYEHMDETEYVWQIPVDPKPKGILFLAHGCQCRATFFWDKHERCRNCTGMPEERTLVLHALARGYAVIAISSTAECWSSSVDSKKVLKVLKRWISEKGLGHLPVVGLGASSGGYFISVLALHFKFHSLVIQISSGRFEAMDFDSTYPPTLFVHMPKDNGVAQRVSEARNLLSSKGVRNDEILCSELKVGPNFFSERIPGLSPETSEKIVTTLHQYGYLVHVRKGAYMKWDGRQSGWKRALRKGSVLSYDDRVKWERPLEEEMNLAYAFHEFTSLPSQPIFEWFESSLLNDQAFIATKVS